MKSDNCSLYLTCLFLIILAFGSPALTQPLIFQDPVTARTFQSEKYSGIRGTPFLEEDWMAGWVQVPQGVYKNLRLKIDLYSNTLYFNKNDELWEFQDPVKSFVIFPDASDSTKFREYKKGVNGGGLREDQFVQVLGEGKVSLYRSDIKQHPENERRVKAEEPFRCQQSEILIDREAGWIRENHTDCLLA